jgi:hypothetical protein
MKRLYLLFLAVCAFACNNDNDLAPTQPLGDIAGVVTLYGEAGSCDLLPDHSGVKVFITINGKPKSVLTDSKGYFVFEDMPRGTYEVKYEKENFGTYQQYNIKHLGGEASVLPSILMTEASTLEYSSVQMINSSSISIKFAEKSSTEKYSLCNRFYFLVCVSDSPDVSASNYKEIFSMSYSGYPYEETFTTTIYPSSPQLKGKKVYLKVYNTPSIESSTGYNSYFDIYKNITVYPSVNKGSSVLSTTIF